MKIKFDTLLVDGTIKIPRKFLRKVTSATRFHVILVSDDVVRKSAERKSLGLGKKKSKGDFFDELMRRPATNIGPLPTRDEIYDRDRDREETGESKAYPHLIKAKQ